MISTSCFQPRWPLPSPAAESAISLLPLGRGMRRGGAAAAAGSDARCAAGWRFAFCPAEAASLARCGPCPGLGSGG